MCSSTGIISELVSTSVAGLEGSDPCWASMPFSPPIDNPHARHMTSALYTSVAHPRLVLRFCQWKHKGAWRQWDWGMLVARALRVWTRRWVVQFRLPDCFCFKAHVHVLREHRCTEQQTWSLLSHVRDHWMLWFSSLRLSAAGSFWICSMCSRWQGPQTWPLVYALGGSDRLKGRSEDKLCAGAATISQLIS